MKHTTYKGVLVFLLLILETSCGTLHNGYVWGKDATLFPSVDRIGRSALHAALDPFTLVPTLGAVVFIADDFDSKASQWAAERTPVFGSRQGADNASNILQWCLGGFTVATALATPSGGEAGEWVEAKAKGLGVEGAAFGLAVGATQELKYAVRRTRPNGADELSFPSGHAASGFALATLTASNVDSISLPGGWRIGLKALAYSAASATAWARVEAEQHFPSDVLAGAAIGHFLTAFIHESFLGLPEDSCLFHLEFTPVKKGALLSMGWSF